MPTITAWRQRDFTPLDVRDGLSDIMSDIIRRSIEKTIGENIKNRTTDPQAIFENLKKTLALEQIRENVKTS